MSSPSAPSLKGRRTAATRAPKPEGCSDDVYTGIILKCWDKDPAARPSFVELAAKLDEIAPQTHWPSSRVFESVPPTRARKVSGFDNAHYTSTATTNVDDTVEAYGTQVSVAEAKQRSGFQPPRGAPRESMANAMMLFGEKRKPDVITECVCACLVVHI